MMLQKIAPILPIAILLKSKLEPGDELMPILKLIMTRTSKYF